MEEAFGYDEESFDFEEGPDWDTWRCEKCGKEFVDPEDFPLVTKPPAPDVGLEKRLYWLSPTEVICDHCAQLSGIPPVDKD